MPAGQACDDGKHVGAGGLPSCHTPELSEFERVILRLLSLTALFLPDLSCLQLLPALCVGELCRCGTSAGMVVAKDTSIACKCVHVQFECLLVFTQCAQVICETAGHG